MTMKAPSMTFLPKVQEWKGITLIVLIFFLFFAPLFISGKTLYPIAEGRSVQFFSDNKSAQQAITHPIYLDHGATDWIEAPINASVHHSIKEGLWPLWNPDSSLGMPVLANTNGATMAPLGFFLNFYNSEFAWNFMYVFRLFFAVIFTFSFLRKLGLEQIAAVSGAVLFGFSGYSMLNLNMFHFHVDAMLPFLFWATLNLSQKTSSSSWIFLVLAIIGIILGGNPQNLILGIGTATLFYLALSISKKQEKCCADFFLYSLALFVAAGCCFFYAASFYELFARALKYHDGMGSFSLPLTSLLGLFFPVFVVAPALGVAYLPYLGFLTIPVIAAGTSLTGEFKIATRFFLLIVLFFLLKTVGFPPINWIGSLPVFDNILFTKYLSPFYFSLAVLLALSVQTLLTTEIRKKNFLLGASLAGFVTLVYAYMRLSPLSLETIERHLPSGFILMWGILVTVSVVLCLLIKKFAKGKNAFVYAALCCLLCELLFDRTYDTRQALNAGSAFSSLNFVNFIKSDRTNDYDRIFGVGRILMGNQASLYQIQDIRGLSATLDKRYYTFMKDFVLGEDLDIHPFITTSSLYHAEGRPFLNLLGVKYILFDDCKPHELEAATRVYQQFCMEIYKNGAAFDRSFVLHDYRYFDTEEALKHALKTADKELATTAFLYKTSNPPLPEPHESTGQIKHENEKVSISSYKTDTVKLNVTMKSSGILVLSDIFYPGWNVYVDGTKKDMLNVDYILRGVFLESGQHDVRFLYEPAALRYGLYISALFGALTIGLAYILFRKYPRLSIPLTR